MIGEVSGRTMQDWGAEFDENGFVVLRSVIDEEVISAARSLAGKLWSDLFEDASCKMPYGVRVLWRELPAGDSVPDAIQGGHKSYPELRALRNNQKIFEILAPRLGNALVSVVDTLFFKPPAQPGTGIAFHRDAQFRKPQEEYRDLDSRYVQIGFPLEQHGPDNGGLILAPGSHKDLSIDVVQTRSVRGIDDLESTLGKTKLRTVGVEMEPGDIVLWHPHTIHGSPPNRSTDRSRRFYVVGYMAASSCDAGEPL